MSNYFNNEERRVIFAIDSKSFYASVEAKEHHLNPLRAAIIVVSTGPNVGGGGLILATSPMAKKLYGLKSNVSRLRDLPKDARNLLMVPPRMNLYIHVNSQINDIYREYVDNRDLHIYSIDESFLDMTQSWRLFGDTPMHVARRIQKEVHDKTGIYTTVGIGDNLTQAKIAMDIYGKHSTTFVGEIHYETVPDKLWPINQLNKVWSIGDRTAKKLERIGIQSLADLAHHDPYDLTNKFGVIGGQLYLLSWGIDRAVISDKTRPKEKSYGNSQVLPKNYTKASEIEVVLREISEQVAARIRKHHMQTRLVHVWVGNEYTDGGFSKQTRIIPTNESRVLNQAVIDLFRANWKGDQIRNISVYFGDLLPDNFEQLDFFRTPERQMQERILDKTVDSLRLKFGFTKLVKASSTLPGATAIQRAGLVGGHNGGNSYE
ncbi:Y-family DNA polymerase [Oenococcus kitaharae]|uniref:Nucleotidyltransferase/DNA polymerase for DNA repair n=1 Tax=Oenococcus kitaharae DSM 17330 TaxID=1045004 RepID=G9WGB8_9LACO|nr:Y-family DNA polymerase [Oenococcus kitaharae]EHN59726.1 Nucleotidyltransferase/DNA polymerase for DNA repair [Oenococcus kitaharae DSM 17330]OEY83555.1 excinuclease ABC subunit A [Oenococcus kitaharae]OEY85354.1 excinuclease ABC subunit A [Oenococcus kitaharae]OEY86206.1 excinuclease ABC subunit A [Oenococcus kitaharae]